MDKALARRTTALLAGLALAGSSAASTAEARSPSSKAPGRGACTLQLGADPSAVDLPMPGGGKMRVADVDGDGRPDTILFDFDGDGRWDAGVMDCDRDGAADNYWIDKNRDGKPSEDEIKRIKRRAKPEHIVCLTIKEASRKSCRAHPERVLGLKRLPNLGPVVAPAQPERPLPVIDQLPAEVPTPAPAVEQPSPGPQPVVAGPDTRTPLNLEADVDGDGAAELLVGDTTLGPNQSRLVPGGVLLGLFGGAAVAGIHGVDNDPADQEIVVKDPSRTPNQTYGIDLDGDGDHDVIVIGTGGGATVGGATNADNDPADQEIVVEDPTRTPNQTYGIDLDGDGDHDVIVIGTKP